MHASDWQPYLSVTRDNIACPAACKGVKRGLHPAGQVILSPGHLLQAKLLLDDVLFATQAEHFLEAVL
jgi:hypothetical protein